MDEENNKSESEKEKEEIKKEEDLSLTDKLALRLLTSFPILGAIIWPDITTRDE